MQILVLGMHRSGTSVLTRIINLMGAWVGDEQDILPAHEEDNAAGYWERRNVVRSHDVLLHTLIPDVALHENWMYIAEFHSEHLSALPRDSLDPLRAELTVLNEHQPWVLKDPRMCLLLPVWQTLLTEPVYVLMHRHPLEVVESLSKRMNQPLPISLGLVLWEKYIVSLLQALQGRRVLVVSHARLLANPWQECQRLHAYLVKSAPPLQLPQRAVIEASVNPKLHHAHHDAPPKAPSLTTQQVAIHSELERLAVQRGAITLQTPQWLIPDVMFAEYERLEKPGLMLLHRRLTEYAKLEQSTLTLQRQLQGRDELIAQQQQQSQDRDELIAQQHQQLQDRDELIAQQHQQLQDRDELIAQQQQQLQGRDELIAQQHQQLQARDELIAQQQQQLHGRDELIAQQHQQLLLKDGLLLQTQHSAEQTKAELQKLVDERNQLTQQREALRQYTERLQEALRAMRASWSWRITSPLRFVLSPKREGKTQSGNP